MKNISEMDYDDGHDVSIFKDVQMFASAPSHLLYPEDCDAEMLEFLVDEVWEPVHTPRSFVPWFHYQAKEYLEFALQKRREYILKKYC